MAESDGWPNKIDHLRSLCNFFRIDDYRLTMKADLKKNGTATISCTSLNIFLHLWRSGGAVLSLMSLRRSFAF
eukprot:9480559-Pyramimonas_sp.AAC.2